jgi:hypothetical protein
MSSTVTKRFLRPLLAIAISPCLLVIAHRASADGQQDVVARNAADGPGGALDLPL